MRNKAIAYAAFALFAGLFAPSAALAQSQFRVVFEQGDEITAVAPGGVVSLNAARVGETATAQVSLSYVSGTGATITSISQTGSGNFRFVGVPSTPIEFTGDSRLTFRVEYTARTANAAQTEIRIAYRERPVTPEATAVTGVISFVITGRAPDLQVVYVLESNGNATLARNGDTIPLPETIVGGVSNATVVILNRGSATGQVRSIAVTGDAFTALGLPLLPGDLDSTREARFTLRFAPRTLGVHTGSVRIELADQVIELRPQGAGISSQLSYTIVTEDAEIPVQPGKPGILPSITVGNTLEASVRIRNNGAAEGNISAVSLTGAGFTLVESLVTPIVLRSGTEVTVRIAVTPASPGPVRGRLRVGSEAVELVGSALGSRLEYSYAAGQVTHTVASGGTVIYPPTEIGAGARVSFTIRNTGTTAGTITSVAIADARSAFRVEGVPALPVRLQPEGTVSFDVVFAPTTPGLAASTLRIDAATFMLNGTASAAPTLPAITFTGRESGVVQALEQIPIGISLAAPYPIALRGSLTIAFSSDTFVDDGSIQFSTGGRRVEFSTDANSSQVRFPNGSDQVRLQTGSVAGTITITPSFATSSDDVEVNPSRVPTLTLTVARTAPRLLGIQVIPEATGVSMSLVVTGVSTPRSLRQLTFEFAFDPSVSARIGATSVTADITQIANSWFSSSASSAVGGAFTVTAPFVFTGSTVPFNQLIRSVSVTATNEVGPSNSVRAEVSAP